MNTQLVKKIIDLLPENFETEVLTEGILIKGIKEVEDKKEMPLHKEEVPTPSEFCKTVTPTPKKEIAFIITSSIKNILSEIPDTAVHVMCKEYITEASKHWNIRRRNNIDTVRKLTNATRPRLNTKLLLYAKSTGVSFITIDNIENKLIELNIPIIEELCKL